MSRLAVEEEDAGRLQLGPDFRPSDSRKAAKGLMLAEVKLLMEDKITGDKEKGEESSTTKTTVFQKTFAYVKRFSFQNATVETAQSTREVLAQRGLHEFEVCTLGNLAPSNAEEARALVPSLDLPVDLELKPDCPAPLTDEEVDAMLADVAALRS